MSAFSLSTLIGISILHANLRGLTDTHREKAPSKLTKGTNMGNWVVGTSNQLFIRGS